MLNENSTESYEILRPVLIGCTWYPYARDMPPWGVAQGDLLIGKLPALLLFAPKLICDERAYRQEIRARDTIGWTSSEVLAILHETGLLEKTDFSNDIKNLFEDKHAKAKLDQILDQTEKDEDIITEIRSLDNLLTEGLSVQGTAEDPHRAKSIFTWSTSIEGPRRPFWATADKYLLPLFLNEDFYILPPRNIWPVDILEAHKSIIEIQKPHLADLAKLKISGSLYLERIKNAHGKYDNIMDSFFRKQEHPKYGNYIKRLQFLLDARKHLHNSDILKVIQLEWSKVQLGNKTQEEFAIEIDALLHKTTQGLLRAKRASNAILVGCITVSIVLGGAAIVSPPFVVPALATGSGAIVTALFQRFNIGKDFPLGWFGLHKKSKK